MKKTFWVLALAAVTATSAVACSDSGSGSSGSTLKIAVVTSLSGPAASGFTSTEQGVKARVDMANAAGGVNGHKIEYEMVDDQSSPAGAKAAVQKAIRQDRVFAVLSVSPTFFGAYQDTAATGTPVVGAGFDGGPEWLDTSNKNLFDVLGGMDYAKVATTLGTAAKQMGVTKMAAIGYDESPSAAESAKAGLASASAVGLATAPYQSLHMGSTDVGPAVLAIKDSGADGVYLPVIPSTGFAILAGLAQAGVHPKMIVLATGYGGDLLQSKEATAIANGAYFATTLAPAEANTAGTRKLQQALQSSAGYQGIPTFAQYSGWATADAFLAGLAKSGNNPTQSGFISALRGSTWDGADLSRPVNFGAVGQTAGNVGPDNCVYLPQLVGGKFVVPPGLDPVCGELVPGAKVTS